MNLFARRLAWNLFPCYFFTGARVKRISGDGLRVEVALPLTWRTRNVVGTLFGGFLYAAADPVFMVMLRGLLGKDYVVWDKAASIRFVRPGRGEARAVFALDSAELDAIRAAVARDGRVQRVYPVEWKTKEGEITATLEKTLWIGSKDYVRAKKEKEKADRETEDTGRTMGTLP